MTSGAPGQVLLSPKKRLSCFLEAFCSSSSPRRVCAGLFVAVSHSSILPVGVVT